MSYCRFGWEGSEVYVFESAQGLECCGCKLASSAGYTTSEPEKMIEHLAQHRRAGHYVPPHAILALWEDVPGAQRPERPEPPALTRASLLFAIAQLQERLKAIPEK